MLTIEVDSSLVAVASQFAGRYVPFSAVTIEPAFSGGVLVWAVPENGSAAYVAWDEKGRCPEQLRITPDPQLIKLCRGIKTARRTLVIDEAGEQGALFRRAEVVTSRKTSSQAVETRVMLSPHPAPALASVMAAILETWDDGCLTSTTGGNYDPGLVSAALSAMEGETSVTLCGWGGGPMRVQRQDGRALVLVMPQTAEPLRPVPTWLRHFAKPPGSAGNPLELAPAPEPLQVAA